MKPLGLTSILIGVLPVVATAASPAHATGREEDRAVVERNIRDSIGWALTKDRARLESVLSRDEHLFMFQPTSDATIVGWESLARAFEFWMDPRFVATHFDVRDLRVSFSRSGDVAWFSAILDDHGEWDGKAISWEDTRWTGVLERRDDNWVIVQMHFSFAADHVLSWERGKGGAGGSAEEDAQASG